MHRTTEIPPSFFVEEFGFLSWISENYPKSTPEFDVLPLRGRCQRVELMIKYRQDRIKYYPKTEVVKCDRKANPV